MSNEIRHRRLHAFFNSKVLNALMIVIIVCLLLTAVSESMLLPAVGGALALLLFIGYSLWLWIWKPARIVINSRLSDISGLFTLYYLLIAGFHPAGPWWYIIPVGIVIVLLFLMLITSHDEQFDIE